MEVAHTTMEYELAKKLKNAGFPQFMNMGEYHYGNTIGQIDQNCWRLQKVDDDTAMEWVKIPTLSELIEACGEEFNNMFHIEKKWRCCSFQDEDVMGNTPEEAVANLWLELNKK